MSERDVHFAQFAQSVARELTEAGVFFDTTGIGQQILAQRAYDLALYTLRFVDSVQKPMSWEEVLHILPDIGRKEDV